jgi:hypothetical protein
MQGKGVERAILFLERIVGLEIQKNSVWQELMNIRDVRNLIVHSNARVKDLTGKNRNIAKYVEASPYLSVDEEIIVEEEYLDYVLEKFELQFREIDNAIRSSLSST